METFTFFYTHIAKIFRGTIRMTKCTLMLILHLSFCKSNVTKISLLCAKVSVFNVISAFVRHFIFQEFPATQASIKKHFWNLEQV